MDSLRSPVHRLFVGALGVALVTTACGPKGPPLPPPASLSGPGSSRAEVLERDEMSPGAASMAELIEARIPNVIIRRGGGGAWVEIRGQGSINSASEALIIVDGIQLTSSGFLSMNPDDVQRIQVLRDGSAAIYGVRGGNGVLVVTTRRQGQ